MAGRAVTSDDIDNTLVQLVQMVFQGLRGLQGMDEALFQPNNQEEFAEAFGYEDPEEVSALYSSMTELRDLYKTFNGDATDYPLPRELKAQPLKLLGTGVY